MEFLVQYVPPDVAPRFDFWYTMRRSFDGPIGTEEELVDYINSCVSVDPKYGSFVGEILGRYVPPPKEEGE